MAGIRVTSIKGEITIGMPAYAADDMLSRLLCTIEDVACAVSRLTEDDGSLREIVLKTAGHGWDAGKANPLDDPMTALVHEAITRPVRDWQRGA
jgi:hypothetical protein